MVKVKVLESVAIPWTPEEDTNYGGVQIVDEQGNVAEAGDEVDLDQGMAQALFSRGYVEDVDGVLVGSEPEPEPEPPPTAEEVGVERPAVADNKDAWSDYVESLGGDPVGKTKNELIDLADELELEAGGE